MREALELRASVNLQRQIAEQLRFKRRKLPGNPLPLREAKQPPMPLKITWSE
jgi:hypothetical protein